jgi:FkbM family methyltransferase
MGGKGLKRAITPIYRALFGDVARKKEKARLRAKLMQLPITGSYPFDIEAKLLRSIGVKPAMLDIGANNGTYSSLLEDIVGSRNLYLFEPLPHLHARLRRLFKQAHVFDLGLSNSTGTQIIRVPYIDGKRFDTRATFNAHSEPHQTGADEIPVQFSCLDTIAQNIEFDSIGFMKIDVEGHELAVLEGATETIRRHKPLLLIEIEARHHQFPIAEIFSKLEGMGYRGHYIDPGAFSLLDVAGFDAQRDQNQDDLVARRFGRYLNNFFFVPEADQQSFVAKVRGFLEEEKRLVAEL